MEDSLNAIKIISNNLKSQYSITTIKENLLVLNTLLVLLLIDFRIAHC